MYIGLDSLRKKLCLLVERADFLDFLKSFFCAILLGPIDVSGILIGTSFDPYLFRFGFLKKKICLVKKKVGFFDLLEIFFI